MKRNPSDVAKARAPAIALISLAVLGLILFFLAALAPVYGGDASGFRPSTGLMGLGAILFGASIFGAVALVLLGFNRNRK